MVFDDLRVRLLLWRFSMDANGDLQKAIGRSCIFVMKVTPAILWGLYVTFCPVLVGYSLSSRKTRHSQVEVVQPLCITSEGGGSSVNLKVRRLKLWELKLKPILNLLLVLKNTSTYFVGLVKNLHFYHQSLAYRNHKNDVLSFSQMCNSLGLATIRSVGFTNQFGYDPALATFEASNTSYESFLDRNLQSNFRLFYQNGTFLQRVI